MIPFDKDEWETWREHPIGTWFFEEYLIEHAAEAKNRFIEIAWENGTQDKSIYAALRERHNVLLEMQSLKYEDLEEAS